MFSKDHLINNISLSITALISSIYFFKYYSIYINVLPQVITAAYFIIFIFLLKSLGKAGEEKFNWLNKRKFVLLILLIIIFASAYVIFFPRLGRLGRLPAIADWLDRLSAGEYPYNKTFLPSAFPVLFFLAAPFYLINNIGLLEVIGLGIFLLLILFTSKNTKEYVTKLVIAAICPVVLFEIAVRSELLTNTVLTILLILLSEKYLEEEKTDFKFFAYAVLFGLLLSTRSVVALIYVIYLPYKFRYELAKGFFFAGIIFFVFLLTLLPFVIWSPEEFFNYGPFAVQSLVSFLPVWIVAPILFFALLISWGISDIQEVFFTSGIFLFLAAFFSMLHKFFAFGIYSSIVLDRFDISYLIFCVPFFVLSIKDYKVDKFLRKVLED